MKKDYQTLNQVNWIAKKKYLLSIASSKDIKDDLYLCMNMRQFKKLCHDRMIMKALYKDALDHLYHTHNDDELEYHLIMMNHLFNESHYQYLKDQLLDRLCQSPMTLEKYCIIRHLIDFKTSNFMKLVHIFEQHLDADALLCARICVIEDQYDLAYQYLLQLDSCDHQALLDLIRDHSLMKYILLKKHYHDQKNASYEENLWERECITF